MSSDRGQTPKERFMFNAALLADGYRALRSSSLSGNGDPDPDLTPGMRLTLWKMAQALTEWRAEG